MGSGLHGIDILPSFASIMLQVMAQIVIVEISRLLVPLLDVFS
jgi:hypothetical protein